MTRIIVFIFLYGTSIVCFAQSDTHQITEKLETYYCTGSFNKGYTWAMNEERKIGFINEAGQEITLFIYDFVIRTKNGWFATIYNNGAMTHYILNSKGNAIAELNDQDITNHLKYDDEADMWDDSYYYQTQKYK